MDSITIKCYQTLIEMEAENQKINEMIMAPKFAKLLNESVDVTDFTIHKTKTIETVSEFVNRAFNFTTNFLHEALLQIEDNKINNHLVLACEAKVKSLTKEDRDNFVLESVSSFNNLDKSKSQIIKDIKAVNTGLSKILECSFNTSEEYSKKIKPFKKLVSECVERLHNSHNYETIPVSINELSNVLNRYKNTNIIVENNLSTLNEIKNGLDRCKKSIKSKDSLKLKEAVYEATGYLMTAIATVEEFTNKSHLNNEEILSEFIRSETSEESTSLFESTMTNIIRQRSVNDDDDDFI